MLDEYQTKKEAAKILFTALKYNEAFVAYRDTLDVCNFKDELVTVYSNMAMCSIKVHKYEQALVCVNSALEKSTGSDINPEVMIKLKYRLALCLAHLRDYD